MPVGKFTTIFGDVSVLHVCKFNTNYAIKFHNCSGKKILLYVSQKMLLKMWRELVKHSVVLGCLFIDFLTKDPYHWI